MTAVRLLHVSDTHIGAAIGRRSRLGEQEAVLEEIGRIARQNDVDVILHTGDLFHHRTPSGEALAIASGALYNWGSDDRDVYVLTGNHDNADVLRALDTFSRRHNVHLVSHAQMINVRGLELLAVPFLSPGRLLRSDDLVSGVEFASYGEAFVRYLRDAAAHIQPQIIACHVTISGGRVGVGERPLTIADTYAVEADQLPFAEYYALGHLHRSQEIALPRGTGFYAGSTLQLDFGEAGDCKRVLIVDFEDGELVSVTPIDLQTPRPLVDLAFDWSDPDDRPVLPDDAYARLTVAVDAPSVGLVGAIEDAYPQALQIKIVTPDQDPAADDRHILERAPRDALELYWLERHGEALADPVGAAFDALCEEAWA